MNKAYLFVVFFGFVCLLTKAQVVESKRIINIDSLNQGSKNDTGKNEPVTYSNLKRFAANCESLDSVVNKPKSASATKNTNLNSDSLATVKKIKDIDYKINQAKTDRIQIQMDLASKISAFDNAVTDPIYVANQKHIEEQAKKNVAIITKQIDSLVKIKQQLAVSLKPNKQNVITKVDSLAKKQQTQAVSSVKKDTANSTKTAIQTGKNISKTATDSLAKKQQAQAVSSVKKDTANNTKTTNQTGKNISKTATDSLAKKQQAQAVSSVKKDTANSTKTAIQTGKNITKTATDSLAKKQQAQAVSSVKKDTANSTKTTNQTGKNISKTATDSLTKKQQTKSVTTIKKDSIIKTTVTTTKNVPVALKDSETKQHYLITKKDSTFTSTQYDLKKFETSIDHIDSQSKQQSSNKSDSTTNRVVQNTIKSTAKPEDTVTKKTAVKPEKQNNPLKMSAVKVSGEINFNKPTKTKSDSSADKKALAAATLVAQKNDSLLKVFKQHIADSLAKSQKQSAITKKDSITTATKKVTTDSLPKKPTVLKNLVDTVNQKSKTVAATKNDSAKTPTIPVSKLKADTVSKKQAVQKPVVETEKPKTQTVSISKKDSTASNKPATALKTKPIVPVAKVAVDTSLKKKSMDTLPQYKPLAPLSFWGDSTHKPVLTMRPFFENGMCYFSNSTLIKDYNTKSMYFFGLGFQIGHIDNYKVIPYTQMTFAKYSIYNPKSSVDTSVSMTQVILGVILPLFKFNDTQIRMKVGYDLSIIKETIYKINQNTFGLQFGFGLERKFVGNTRVFIDASYLFQETKSTTFRDFNLTRISFGFVL